MGGPVGRMIGRDAERGCPAHPLVEKRARLQRCSLWGWAYVGRPGLGYPGP
jgi:hypothetical protein